MKILYVTTISNTVNAFLIPHIRMLISMGYTVDVAFNIVQGVSPEIIGLGCKVYNVEFQRSPLKKQNYIAYKKIKKIIKDEAYDMVHTHTPVASALVRLACRHMQNVRIIYTAHGFHFYKGAPIKNWLIYYPIEWFLSKYTDLIITINKEDYVRAKRTFISCIIKYIPGVGVDVKKISKVIVDKASKRCEVGIPYDAFLVISVGELNENKNHEIIIKAIAKMNNPNIYYFICGQGHLRDHLYGLIKRLHLEKQVKLLGYRKDIIELNMIADVFAFPSKREGLGVAAIEAMACGLPIVTSNIHGIVDYSVNGETGYSCNPNDVNEFVKAISRLKYDEKLRDIMGNCNITRAKKFDLDFVTSELGKIYSLALTKTK
jgi:glycosyltransferase involved in cell wall biosynthesis